MRTSAMAQATGLLIVFVLFPHAAFLIAWTAAGWRTAAMAVATRATFGFETGGRPAAAAVCGFMLLIATTFLVFNLVVLRPA